MTTTLQPVASSNSNLDCVSVSAGTRAGSETNFAALCSALMPSSFEVGGTDPTATQDDSTLANGGSEPKSAGDPGRALRRELPDDKTPDTNPAFHPFLPSLLIAVPFSAPVPPSQNPGESLPLLSGPDAHSAHTATIPEEADTLTAVISKPVQPAWAQEPGTEWASAAAISAGRAAISEKQAGGRLSTATSGAANQEFPSSIGGSRVAPSDQDSVDALAGRPSETFEISNDQEMRDVQVAQGLPEFDAPASDGEIVSKDTGPEPTSAAAQFPDDSAPLRSPAPAPLLSSPGLIDVAPEQSSGKSGEPIVSAPAQIAVPAALGQKQRNSRLRPEISNEQKPRLANGNLPTKQEHLDPAVAVLPPAGAHISRTAPRDENVSDTQAAAGGAVTVAAAAPLAQSNNDGATSFENSKEKTGSIATPAADASGAGVSAGSKPFHASQHEDDSSSAPGRNGSPANMSAAVGGVNSPVTIAPAAPDHGRMTDASTPQNHATGNNPGHHPLGTEISAGATMPSEVAAGSRLTGVEMARVIAKAGHSEMRIGLSTSAFGSVEVHTVVHADEVGVVIGSERGDLPGLIRSELPAISHNLQQQDVRLNQVNFQQQGFGFSADSQSGGHSQPRSFPAKGNFESPSVSQGATAESSPVIEPLGRPGTGLSILA